MARRKELERWKRSSDPECFFSDSEKTPPRAARVSEEHRFPWEALQAYGLDNVATRVAEVIHVGIEALNPYPIHHLPVMTNKQY